MFISHFNRYFEKHAKITYFVLLIVIIATFVIFVTPGDVLGGNGRPHSDIGTMFGKKIKAEAFQKEVSKTTLAIWFQYPQLFGQSLTAQKQLLFEQTLMRMRLTHDTKARGILKKVTDEDVKNFYRTFPLIQDNGKFSGEAFTNLMAMCTNSFGLNETEVDQVIRETIAIERLQEEITNAASVTDSDVDDAMAQYTIQCATVRADMDAALPNEAEIKNFFDTRKGEIKLPNSKNADVAYFNYADLTERFKKELTPTAEQVKEYFDNNSKVLYKDKEFSAVESEISNTLLQNKIRVKARELATALARDFSSDVANEDVQARRQRFLAQAVKSGAVCHESGWISLGSKVSGKAGDQIALARAIRNLNAAGKASDMVVGADYTAVAFINEVKETALPAELNDDVSKFISDLIVREHALAFYNDNIKVPYEQFSAVVKPIAKENNGRQPNAADRQRIAEAQSKLDMELVSKFYIPENRNFVRVIFPSDAYLGNVAMPSDEDLQKAYDENKAEYQRIEVRLATIGIDIAGLEGDALKAKLDKINAAKQKLDAGADFMTVAKEYAENSVIEEKNMSDLANKPEALKNAIAGLEKGQITPIIEVDGQRQIVKMIERRDGRSLTDVRDELIKSIRDSQAAMLARQDAQKLSEDFSNAWWKASEANEEFDGASVLKNLSENYKQATFASFEHVTPDQRAMLDGHPTELLAALFSASEGAPVIETVTSSNGDAFVGYLTGITEERIADPAVEDSYYPTLRNAYLEKTSMDNAEAKAEAEIKRIADALKDGKDFATAGSGLEFTALPPFSIYDVMNNSAIVKSIASSKNVHFDEAFITELKALKEAGQFMKPLLAERHLSYGQNSYSQVVIPLGYQLFYIAERNIPQATEADKEARATLRNQLLNIRKQQLMSAYLEDLDSRAQTQLREGVMP